MTGSYPDSDEYELPDIGRRAFQEGHSVSEASACWPGAGALLFWGCALAGCPFQGKELLPSQREPSLRPQPYASHALFHGSTFISS